MSFYPCLLEGFVSQDCAGVGHGLFVGGSIDWRDGSHDRGPYSRCRPPKLYRLSWTSQAQQSFSVSFEAGGTQVFRTDYLQQFPTLCVVASRCLILSLQNSHTRKGSEGFRGT